MIIARAPLRIPLAGGGTDLPSYYSRYGGFVMSAAIDKYVFVVLNSPKIGGTEKIKYALGGRVEVLDAIDEVPQPFLREACKLVGVDGRLEITSMADIPAGTGLGSSGAFLVALLTALHAYKREAVTPEQIAEEACQIEIDRVGKPVGKQDQYIASIGGITCMNIAMDGRVALTSLGLTPHQLELLRSSLVVYYTGIRREDLGILAAQRAETDADQRNTVENLHCTKQIGHAIQDALRADDIDRFGELLDVHWQNKRRRSAEISDAHIDEWYERARGNGALGGKLIGAGGGGFLLFCCKHDQKSRLRSALTEAGLQELSFAFDFDGAKVVVNI